MKLKQGTSIAGSSVEIQMARAIAQVIWDYFGQELVVTGGTEIYTIKEGVAVSAHVENSKHAYGDADDYRVRYFLLDAQKLILAELKRKLQIIGNYTILLHEGHHMHVQHNRR